MFGNHKPTLWQHMVMLLHDYADTGRVVTSPSWTAPFKVFVLKCPDHGFVESTMRSYKGWLDCPFCDYKLQTRGPP